MSSEASQTLTYGKWTLKESRRKCNRGCSKLSVSHVNSATSLDKKLWRLPRPAKKHIHEQQIKILWAELEVFLKERVNQAERRSEDRHWRRKNTSSWKKKRLCHRLAFIVKFKKENSVKCSHQRPRAACVHLCGPVCQQLQERKLPL